MTPSPTLEAAEVRWTRLNEMWIRSNNESFDLGQMMALFEAASHPSDPDPSGIADQLVALAFSPVTSSGWSATSARRPGLIVPRMASPKRLKFKLAQIDQDEVGSGDS
jgi:hypothetical protein